MDYESLAKLNIKRLEAVQRHEIPDQVPFIFYEDGWVPCQRYGVSVEKYMKDAKTMLEVQLRNSRQGLFWGGGLFVDTGILIPASAFGAPVRYDDKHMPWIEKTMVKEPRDLEKLEIPDPDTCEPMQKAIECYYYLKEHAPEDLRESVEFFPPIGPIDTSALLRGTSEFMSDLLLHPEFARKLIEIATEANIVWLKKINEIVGGLKVVKLGDDYAGYVSKKVWQEFVFPYEKRIYDTIPDTIRWFHTDGPRIQQEGVLESLAEMGVDLLYGLHPQVNLEGAKRRLQPLNIAMAFGIPPVDILLRGPVNKIDEWCKKCIQVAAPGGNYALGPSGGDAPGTPIEHYLAVISATEKYGKYPIKI